MFSLILSIICFLILVPILVFSVECFCSFLPDQNPTRNLPPVARKRLAVIIPAHNEELCVKDTVNDVLGQLQDGDRVLVVADNCSDDTAQVARDLGAEVAVRHNDELRGKSYALEYGLAELIDAPPEIVIFIDADCRLSPNALTALATTAAQLDRPVQGSYIFGGKKGSAVSNMASSLTLRFKNYIRPLGSLRIGMPCQLTGSGMAFPWHVLQLVDVANGSLTEDAELGVDLALAGYPPIFCAEAKINGSVPKGWDAHVQQRRRWEQGYLESIMTNAPKMVGKAIWELRPSLLWSALDLCIPPLALLGLAWLAFFGVSMVSVSFGGSWIPALMLLTGALLLALSIVLGWHVHCRNEIGVKSLLSIPWFLLRKMSIYGSLIFKREHVWLRTERD